MSNPRNGLVGDPGRCGWLFSVRRGLDFGSKPSKSGWGR
ncbi:hypothetical protein RB8573 [Rhodopirellula baltica SH 1]|uniref:Uncharacterized protein n=1 Tax=Rhodopirellula baltica (strain DSM 10527 / NCIMB 13988 / SH1) TaxID=243090 RepID=Q7UMU7_RHOBA|nr:hypothetical protein RB8573 [Rhodopirellula baltica SH 1]